MNRSPTFFGNVDVSDTFIGTFLGQRMRIPATIRHSNKPQALADSVDTDCASVCVATLRLAKPKLPQSAPGRKAALRCLASSM